MDDALIRKIVLTVIEQLNKPSVNSIFVLSNNSVFCFQNELESIGYKVDVSSSVNGINIDNYDIIVLDDLSVELLSCISNLLYKDDNTSFIINALLSGKKVIGLKSSERFENYKKTVANALFSKLLDMENIAKSYGLIISESLDFFSYFNNENEIVNIDNNFDLRDKKIITQDDILDVVNKYSGIIVNKHAIITPLVLDYTRENKINILYE